MDAKPYLVDDGTIPQAPDPSHRDAWLSRRKLLEAAGERSTPLGCRPGVLGRLFNMIYPVFSVALRACGLYRAGVRNALDLRLREIELEFADLPAAFDGYRILHMTDLHIDCLPGLADTVATLTRGVSVDACFITGDYQEGHGGPADPIIDHLKVALADIDARDGIFAILGNHDEGEFGLALERRMDLRLLINEKILIRRGSDRVLLAGTDDVSFFYSEGADAVLASTDGEFGIALVHSPEMAEAAAAGGYSLYLSGHTHGGQVSLPGGRPVVTRLIRNRELAAGLWSCGAMTGYTGPGVGVTAVPVRFFTRGEVTVLTLRGAR